MKRSAKLHEERVTSTYADIYFDDDHCNYLSSVKKKSGEPEKENIQIHVNKDEWVSPSDLLIGIVELTPPFTSKITRGKTHEGILSIGNGVLQAERAKFLKRLTDSLNDNDSGWLHVLQNEKEVVVKKVKKMYNEIFINKSRIMKKEINNFYEHSLHELEAHVRSEIEGILTSARAKITSDLNFEIKRRLKKERAALEKILKEKYDSEVSKINNYYKLLLDNEQYKMKQLVNKVLHERNDALAAFCRQIEADNVTGTMYVMCAERKKCKIKKFILENYQTADVTEKLQKIKERQAALDAFYEREVKISQVNKAWEDKIKKILQLFLKFISFSLKLIPEQATFLLDLEKMVVLQMTEIQKHPQRTASILFEEDEIKNIFNFETCPEPEETCDRDPFIVIGDLNDPTPPMYGSRETLPSDVDLPYIRVQRQFVYAKCKKFEEIKSLLDSQRCKCQDIPSRPLSDISIASLCIKSPSIPTESVSSDEPLFLDDVKRIYDCPARNCQNWAKREVFPHINSYLDFSEQNYERVKSIIGKPSKTERLPNLIDPKLYVTAELPFASTKELYHTVETQYSSQEDLYIPQVGCTCTENTTKNLSDSDSNKSKKASSIELGNLQNRRKISLRNLIEENPNLLKMFTDESYDFVL